MCAGFANSTVLCKYGYLFKIVYLNTPKLNVVHFLLLVKGRICRLHNNFAIMYNFFLYKTF